MSKPKCDEFSNKHCSSSDCPHIQYDMISERCGEDIAEDCGYTRTPCSKCWYYNRTSCNDCLMRGTDVCAERKGK